MIHLDPIYNEQADTEAKLANAEAKLADTEAKLANAEAKLSEAKAELSEAKAELSETKAELSETKAELSEAKQEDEATLNEHLRDLIKMSDAKLSETNDHNIKLKNDLNTMTLEYEKLIMRHNSVIAILGDQKDGKKFDTTTPINPNTGVVGE